MFAHLLFCMHHKVPHAVWSWWALKKCLSGKWNEQTEVMTLLDMEGSRMHRLRVDFNENWLKILKRISKNKVNVEKWNLKFTCEISLKEYRMRIFENAEFFMKWCWIGKFSLKTEDCVSIQPDMQLLPQEFLESAKYSFLTTKLFNGLLQTWVFIKYSVCFQLFSYSPVSNMEHMCWQDVLSVLDMC